MSYEAKENPFKPKGNLFLEVAAILIIVVMMMFAGVLYHFYQEVTRLFEDKAEILARLDEAQRSSGQAQFVKEIQQISEIQKRLQGQVSALGKKLNSPEHGDLAQDLDAVRQRVASLESRAEANAPASNEPDNAVVSKSAGAKVNDQVEVSLLGCADKMMYFYCDVELMNTGLTGLDLKVSNDNTLVRDYSGKVYRVSSFSFRDRYKVQVRHETTIFLNKVKASVLRFRFYEPPSSIPAFASVQFNIGGKIASFEHVLAEN